MAAAEEEGRRFQARVDVEGSGRAQVATGVPILDHLLGLLADRSGFDVWLEVAPVRMTVGTRFHWVISSAPATGTNTGTPVSRLTCATAGPS